MNKLLRSFIASLLVAVSFNLSAQSIKQTRADAKYASLEYFNASELYKEVIEAEPENQFAMVRLANCYRQLAEPEKAAVWYKKGITNESQPVNRLFYAQTLKQLGRYDEAKTEYEAFKKWAPDDPRSDKGLESIRIAENMKNRPFIFQVAAFNTLNTKYNEFAPTVVGNELNFTSDRQVPFKLDQTYGWTGNPFSDNFVSTKSEDGSYSTPQIMSGKTNAQYNDGMATFSSNGKIMAFTRNQYNPGLIFSSTAKSELDEVVKLKVMLAEKNPENGKWMKPFEATFNNPNYSFTHPTFSNDGKTLFFVSDMPGGYGGTDIWKAELDADLLFGPPVNLGPDINTIQDEMFPFIAKDGTLYFSSTGHAGIGGLDVFKAGASPSGNYDDIFNLGAPFNSTKDDFGVYTGDNKEFFLSSNREGGKGGDDIYRGLLTGVIVEMEVLDASSGKPINNATVVFKDGDNVFAPVKTNKYGKITYPLATEKEYTFTTTKENFKPKKETISTADATAGEFLRKKVYLNPDYNSFISGIVIEEKSQLPIGDAQVTLTNKKTGEINTVTTDFTGLYKIEWFPNLEYDLSADKEGYKPDLVTLSTVGLEPNSDTKQNLILKDGEFVCNVSFNNIYFDFDKFNIREDASSDLEKMYSILTNSSAVRVEIGAHTDARGSDAYNYNLSDNRAASVVKYLVKKGIDPSRLISKGYGETELRNECKNNVECDDDQHQQNRRVEFKVINENNEVICSSEERSF